MRALAAVALLPAAAIVGATTALAASSTPPGGAFRAFTASSGPGATGTVLLSGAIGDHGQYQPVTKSGKVSQNGTYIKLTLSQGTLMLNSTKLDGAINRSFASSVPNAANCSVSAAGTGRLQIVSGTGAYTGATGSLHLTISFGLIMPRKDRKCDLQSSANPIASQQIGAGTGTVSFK